MPGTEPGSLHSSGGAFDGFIKSVIAWCALNRALVLLATAAAVAAGWWSFRNIPVDAIPDLSDTQVIIAARWERSPDVLEDQVTYPLVTAMLGTPKARDVRAFTDFGNALVYVIFEDGTDVYWARARVLEQLAKIQPRLPPGARVELGPDATSVGWVYQYALVDDSGKLDLSQLRSLQDWFLRYQLQSVPGVSEVASFGGFVKEYQVRIDPQALLAYNLPIGKVIEALRGGNEDVGARLIELSSGFEYMVRGRGYIKGITDIEETPVGRDPATGTPILVKDVAKVRVGPALRRGVGELNGQGEAVGGVVIMRYGENARAVIQRVRARLKELEPSLPRGVRVVPTYDRSELIERAISTVTRALTEEVIIVCLIILLFLWHIPSALVPILTIPITVLLSFIPMFLFGISANIMTLAGIAISIGVLVDGAIVEVENAYKKLERWSSGDRGVDYHRVRLEAIQEVGPSVFYSLLVIAVAFLPVFTLVDQEGRLFKPLAISKNVAMAIAAVLAVTLDPAVRLMFTRMEPFSFKNRLLTKVANAALVGKYYKEESHPISRRLFQVYGPAVRWVLEHPKRTVQAALAAVALTLPALFSLGSEFMPPLNEGTVLYMPTALPGLSANEAARVLQIQDRLLKSFPEVASVHGKAGRAETATDPAPLSMIETVVVLKPRSEWRAVKRWGFWPGRITYDELINELDAAVRLPGMPNIWTMPIRARIDMLSTGMRTPVGVKIFGPDLNVIQRLGETVERRLSEVEGTRSATAERTAVGYFVDFELKRRDLARYGLTVAEANAALAGALGGEAATMTIEGRERYPVSVRYAPDFRDSVDELKRVLVTTPSGAQIPISQIAELRLRQGPGMIRDENGQLAGYVYVDLKGGVDVGGYVERAKKALAHGLELPAGYSYRFSGQYENMERVKKRLAFVIPLTLLLIVVLIHLNTGSWASTGMVLMAVPFSAIGAVWLLWALDYNMSIAVWVGLIALLGLDAETGMFMLLYLDLEREARLKAGTLNTEADLKEAIHAGAVHRVRPKIMTVACDMIGLLPVMWASGAGSDMMKRIAAPLVGGLYSSVLLELLVYPAVYFLYYRRFLPKKG